MRETAKAATPPRGTCQIVDIVNAGKARVIVGQFKTGAGTRKLAYEYGLSRHGVEELIRSYGWSRRPRKVVAR